MNDHGLSASFGGTGTIKSYFSGEGWFSLILRRIHESAAEDIEANLRAAFAAAESTVPLDVLANYLAGAQIALLHNWLAKRKSYTPENLAQALHRLQRAVICDALGIRDDE